MLSHTLPRRMRLPDRAAFDAVFKAGNRLGDKHLTLWARRNGLGHPRLGLVVGRRHGGAVQRNRLKRILREAFRLQRHELPADLDLVISPRPGVPLELPAAVQSLERLSSRAEERASRFEARDA